MRFLLLVCVVIMPGCVSPKNWFHKVSAVVKTPTTEVRQAGDVAQPAQVTTQTTKTDVPIPAGSTITIVTPAKTDDKKPDPVLVSTSTTEHVVGPTSFQPSAPPTPSQLADGQVKIWFWIGLAIGLAAAIFGLVRDWNFVMYGGIAVASACAFAIFVQAHPLVFVVIGLGIALKFAGPWFWHTQMKNKQPPP